MGSMSHIDIYTKAFKAFNLMTIQSDLQCSLPQESYVTYYCTLQVLWVTFATIEVCHNVHWEQLSKFQHLMKPYHV